MTFSSHPDSQALNPSMTAFQKLCIATIVVVFGLILLGGVVRATDSGLGCPDWPRCHGSFIPKWEKHTLIEYSHRLTASVAGLMVFAIVVAAVRSYRRVPAILYTSIATGVLLLFQAGLGGAAVLNELPPEVIMVHLGTALIILSLLLLITVTSFAIERPLPVPRISTGLTRAAAAAVVVTYGVMLVGSFVSGSGYGLACNGWPLCNGEIVASTDATSVQVVFLHRVLALVLGVAVVWLAWQGWQARSESALVSALAVTSLGLYVLQSLLGAANVWTELADGISAAHLGLGSALWLCLIWLNILVHRLYEFLPLRSESRGEQGLAGMPR